MAYVNQTERVSADKRVKCAVFRFGQYHVTPQGSIESCDVSN